MSCHCTTPGRARHPEPARSAGHAYIDLRVGRLHLRAPRPGYLASGAAGATVLWLGEWLLTR
jgi:hypothetical protein